MLLVNNPGDWGHVHGPLLHAQWHGLTPTDLIVPMFLFVAGVSVSLGLAPCPERGERPPALSRQVLFRAIRIASLGLLLHLCAWWALDLPHFRVMGVLQRIGLCLGFAGVMACRTRATTQWVVLVAVLAGYAALLAAGGTYAPFDNIASQTDARILGVHAYQFEPATGRGHDPEGLLGTLGAFATTLLGVHAGAWLRRGRVRWLWLAGVAALVLGQAWSLVQPLNKNLWTPSFALWSGGFACCVLALAHWAIDRRGLPAWGRAFGVNAIGAYAGSALLVYALAGLGWAAPIYQHGFADWMVPRYGPHAASLAYAIAFVTLWWGVVRALDARGIHLKI